MMIGLVFLLHRLQTTTMERHRPLLINGTPTKAMMLNEFDRLLSPTTNGTTKVAAEKTKEQQPLLTGPTSLLRTTTSGPTTKAMMSDEMSNELVHHQNQTTKGNGGTITIQPRTIGIMLLQHHLQPTSQE